VWLGCAPRRRRKADAVFEVREEAVFVAGGTVATQIVSSLDSILLPQDASTQARGLATDAAGDARALEFREPRCEFWLRHL
jgi:hypothetical protein